MDDAWFTDYADELATCLLDAERCADACERLLADVRDGTAPQLARLIVAPTAVARVLVDLVEHPPELVLAAVRLCAETAATAVRELEALGALEAGEALDALRACAASCRSFDAVAG